MQSIPRESLCTPYASQKAWIIRQCFRCFYVPTCSANGGHFDFFFMPNLAMVNRAIGLELTWTKNTPQSILHLLAWPHCQCYSAMWGSTEIPMMGNEFQSWQLGSFLLPTSGLPYINIFLSPSNSRVRVCLNGCCVCAYHVAKIHQKQGDGICHSKCSWLACVQSLFAVVC